MKELSTHRTLQLAELADKCTAKAAEYHRAALVASQRGSKRQWLEFFGRAARCEQIVSAVRARGVDV